MHTTTTAITLSFVLLSTTFPSTTWAFSSVALSPSTTSTSWRKGAFGAKLHATPSNHNNHDFDDNGSSSISSTSSSRRNFITSAAAAAAALVTGATLSINKAASAAGDLPDSLDVDSFLKSGMVSNPMGVSGQAGKSRPETGVVLREGSEASRDARTGDVLAEILVGSQSNPTPILASFSSPWPIATGTVFDVECRDSNTGDGAFLSVTGKAAGKSIGDLPPSFFLNQVFSSTGRFSFYGSPTDIKLKKSKTDGAYRYLELAFSTLSQATQTEIPRVALVAATIPEGTDEVVMLVGSTTASRWRKGSDNTIRKTVESFRAIPAPTSGLKIRAKERGNTNA